jgi:predicted transcriptional regulator of viral defense system
MDDAMDLRPDAICLFAMASTQHGFFTTPQARLCGYSRALLSSHARSGRFVRVRRGLYRLRDYPSSPIDEVAAAWLAVGKDTAVVSHDTALNLFDLGDVIPGQVHLTVPRSRRHLPRMPGVAIHTTTRPLDKTDVVVRNGVRITSPTRTIVDFAEAGGAPEQVEMAVRQAIARGLVHPERLVEAARTRSHRVFDLIKSARDQSVQGNAR